MCVATSRVRLTQLEEALMMADIGAATTGEILDDVRAIAKEDQLDPDDVKSVLRGRLIDALSVQGRGMNLAQQKAAEGEEDEEAQVRDLPGWGGLMARLCLLGG